MRQQWLKLSAKYAAREPREKVILFAAGLMIVAAAFWNFGIDPALTRQKRAVVQERADQQAMVQIQQQIAEFEQAKRNDPNIATRNAIDAVGRQILLLKGRLTNRQAELADPKHMPDRLRDLLQQEKGLELISMRTLDVDNLMKATSDKGAGQAKANGNTEPPKTKAGVYRHALEISVRGDYAAVTSWLKSIESLNWRIYWGSLKLKVDEYPNSIVTVTISTLSLDPVWMRL